MRMVGFLLIALGLLLVLAFVASFLAAPDAEPDPAVSGSAVDGLFFAAAGALLLLLAQVFGKRRPPE
jgi:hypothetical protein